MVRFPYFLTCNTDNELSSKFLFGFPWLLFCNRKEDEETWNLLLQADDLSLFYFVAIPPQRNPSKFSVSFKSFHLNFLTKIILEWSNQTKKCALFCVSLCNDCIIVIKNPNTVVLFLCWFVLYFLNHICFCIWLSQISTNTKLSWSA